MLEPKPKPGVPVPEKPICWRCVCGASTFSHRVVCDRCGEGRKQ